MTTESIPSDTLIVRTRVIYFMCVHSKSCKLPRSPTVLEKTGNQQVRSVGARPRRLSRTFGFWPIFRGARILCNIMYLYQWFPIHGARVLPIDVRRSAGPTRWHTRVGCNGRWISGIRKSIHDKRCPRHILRYNWTTVHNANWEPPICTLPVIAYEEFKRCRRIRSTDDGTTRPYLTRGPIVFILQPGRARHYFITSTRLLHRRLDLPPRRRKRWTARARGLVSRMQIAWRGARYSCVRRKRPRVRENGDLPGDCGKTCPIPVRHGAK